MNDFVSLKIICLPPDLYNGRGKACQSSKCGHWSEGCLGQVGDLWHEIPRQKFGPILTSGIFFMLYQFDFDSHVIQTILLSTVWVSDSAWFAVDRNTQHQALHDSFHR